MSKRPSSTASTPPIGTTRSSTGHVVEMTDLGDVTAETGSNGTDLEEDVRTVLEPVLEGAAEAGLEAEAVILEWRPPEEIAGYVERNGSTWWSSGPTGRPASVPVIR